MPIYYVKGNVGGGLYGICYNINKNTGVENWNVDPALGGIIRGCDCAPNGKMIPTRTNLYWKVYDTDGTELLSAGSNGKTGTYPSTFYQMVVTNDHVLFCGRQYRQKLRLSDGGSDWTFFTSVTYASLSPDLAYGAAIDSSGNSFFGGTQSSFFGSPPTTFRWRAGGYGPTGTALWARYQSTETSMGYPEGYYSMHVYNDAQLLTYNTVTDKWQLRSVGTGLANWQTGFDWQTSAFDISGRSSTTKASRLSPSEDYLYFIHSSNGSDSNAISKIDMSDGSIVNTFAANSGGDFTGLAVDENDNLYASQTTPNGGDYAVVKWDTGGNVVAQWLQDEDDIKHISYYQDDVAEPPLITDPASCFIRKSWSGAT
jgi:hypothetical protein